MRLAAVSDIHGNLPALDAVLADIAREKVDVIVNLGDIVSGPLQPLEIARRLMTLALPTICGNHESAAVRAEAQGRRDWADALRSGRVGRTEREALRQG